MIKHETLKKIPKRLKKVEELFDVAQDVLETCQIPTEENPKSDVPEESENPSVEIVEAGESREVSEYSNPEIHLPRIFNLEEVRYDFVSARRNLYKLIKHCQDLMDGVPSLDIVDMKASQIEAVSLLANSINNQIQTVMRLYKDMAEIEQMRMPPELKFLEKRLSGSPGRPSNNKDDSSSSESNDAVYVGDSKSLMDIIEENS